MPRKKKEEEVRRPAGYVKLTFSKGKVVNFDMQCYPRTPSDSLVVELIQMVERHFLNPNWEAEAMQERDETV
jgi:hypothetical protein